MNDVELTGLVGKHLLTGVDFETEKIKSWGEEYEDCEVVNFVLGGKTYTAVEDPEDGYRSCMRYLRETENPVKNSFPPCEVLGQMRENDKWENHDILDFVDTVTGKVVLSIGTGNTDDYYPYWVASFTPGHMAINQSV